MAKSLEELTAARAVPRIAEPIADLIVPVDDLHPHPENPRRGDIGALVTSLERFGQVRPIIALVDGTIVAGHHVYYAARQMGWDRIAAVRVEMDPAQARAYLIADNRLAELGGYDEEALGKLLESVQSVGSLEGTGYRERDIERFLKGLDGPSGERAGTPAGAVTCPMCGEAVE